MKYLFLLMCLLMATCNVTGPQKEVPRDRLSLLKQGLNKLDSSEDVTQYCFEAAAFEDLDSSEEYDLHMSCGNILYNRGEYVLASMEYLFARSEKGISKQQVYEAILGKAYSDMESGIPLFTLVSELEGLNIDYGPEAVALNLYAFTKTKFSCHKVAPLVKKLVTFDNWREHLAEDEYLKIQKWCDEF